MAPWQVGCNCLHLNKKDKDAGLGAVPFWDLERCQEIWLTFFPSASLLSLALIAIASRPGQKIPAEACRQQSNDHFHCVGWVLARAGTPGCWKGQGSKPAGNRVLGRNPSSKTERGFISILGHSCKGTWHSSHQIWFTCKIYKTFLALWNGVYGSPIPAALAHLPSSILISRLL